MSMVARRILIVDDSRQDREIYRRLLQDDAQQMYTIFEADTSLVEDDSVDVKTVQRAFREHHLTNPLHVTGNGEEALEFLRHEGRYAQSADAPRPSLILLDLNMPVMNGFELLRVIKADDGLKSIPVVVLTSSRESPDRLASYKLGVAGYITKPVDFLKFLEAVKIFDLYWSLCELP